jgi:hypothetical protein
MDKFVCDWCRAHIVETEKMVSLSRYAVGRKPKRYVAHETYFDSGEQELSFHEGCLVRNSREIFQHLYPDGAEQPLMRPADIDFPMLHYPT